MSTWTQDIFDGQCIGRLDKNGVPIKCGDHVEVTERKDSYRVTSTEDGWGKTVSLCRHDQFIVPAEVKVSHGVVKYSERFCGFNICFVDRRSREDFLYMFKEIEVVPGGGEGKPGEAR